MQNLIVGKKNILDKYAMYGNEINIIGSMHVASAYKRDELTVQI